VPDFMSAPPHRSQYRIQRKGSRYNIFGPDGRIFAKFKSASVVGPRWEELTRTPWPYESSAYQPGKRLWELGVLRREQVGKHHPVLPSIAVMTYLALPAPRINLDEHESLMRSLRREPSLLFNPRIQQALRHEVEYHRPRARWAQHLLRLLDRYERRQRRQHPMPQPVDSRLILERHIAWQKQRLT
jgi:hypothetical protein